MWQIIYRTILPVALFTLSLISPFLPIVRELVSISAQTADAATTFDAYYDVSFVLTALSNDAIPAVTKPSSKASSLATPSYIDPVYGTRVYRATQASDYPGATHIRHDYSRRQASNADNTRYLEVTSNGYWLLYDGSNFNRLTRSGVNGALANMAGDAEAFWHPTDPTKLWYNRGGLIWYEKNVETDTDTVLVDFAGRLPWAQAEQAWTKAEGVPSADGRYWAFMATRYDSGTQSNIIYGLFSWDRQTDTILGTYAASNFGNNFPDHISVSPSGEYVVPSWAYLPSLGTRAYTRDFSSYRQLHTQSEHSDLAVGPDGEDYYVLSDYDSGFIRAVDMATGTSFNLLTIYPGANHSSYANHISGMAYGKPGWVLVSTYADTGNYGTIVPDSTLQPMYRKLFLVELKPGGRILNVAHTRAAANYGGYFGEHQATISRDGTRIFWASNFDDAGSPSDYMIGLPSWAIPNATTDSSAPTVPTNVSATAASATAIDLSWTASTDNTAVAGYALYRDGAFITNITSGTTYQDTGLTASTTYSYRLTAYDAVGNTSAQSTAVNGTTSAPVDATPPTISLTAPTNNSNVFGTVVLSATASDNVGVLGVQFRIDSVNVGAEDTSAPYSISWDTTQTTNGSRLVSASARDAAGNSSSSGSILVTVNNAPSDSTPPTITAVSTDKANGSYKQGEVIDIDVTFSEAVTSTGTVTVTLETGTTDRTCTFTVSNATTGTCNYTVQAGDTSSDLTVNSISGTIADQASNAMVSFAPATNLAANKAIIVDTTNPAGSITAPSAGATVSGSSTMVSATATDGVAVASVQFRLDGGVLGSADTTSPYSIAWNTTSVSNGPHALSALITDTAGNSFTTGNVSVTVANAVPDTTAPAVSMTAPTNGATLSNAVTLQASASDAVGIASVQFIMNGSNFSSPDTAFPYEVSWDTKTVSNGTHTLAARATDTSGNSTTSSSVSVSVSNTTVSSGGGSSSGGGGGGGGKKKKKKVSAKINYRAGERTAPYISLVTPKRGMLTAKSFSVQAVASDRSGIQAMFVSVNGTKKKRTNAASIAYTVGALRRNASITIDAYDALGNRKTALVSIVGGRVVGVRYW